MKNYIKYLSLILLFTFLLNACSKNDEPKLSSYEKELIGGWKNDYKTVGLVFCKDHTGYTFKSDDPTDKYEIFTWETLSCENESSYNRVILNLSFPKTTIEVVFYYYNNGQGPTHLAIYGNLWEDDWTGNYVSIEEFTAPDSANEGEDSDNENENGNNSNNSNNSKLVGKWFASPSSSISNEYIFYENGTGYFDETQMKGDMGIYREWYSWSTKNGVITLKRESSSDKTLNYEMDGDNLMITDKNGKSLSYRHSAISSIKPYGEVPYKNGYILNKNTGYYYQISMVKEFCQHATSGEKTNWKFIQFFGEEGTLKPTGLYCYYTTPYYEGIDGIWSSGTYTMLGNGGSGYYKYGAVCYIRNAEPYLSTKDKLIVKKEGNKYEYDYIGDEVRLHLEATK